MSEKVKYTALLKAILWDLPADRQEDLREQFEERAAICEYDANMARSLAESMAFGQVKAALQEK